MDELTQTRLITGAVVAAIVAAFALSRFVDRRREKHFVELGRSLGARVERESEFLSRFVVSVAGRAFEVRRQHIGDGSAPSWNPGWCLLTTTDLEGVSTLHAADIRPRSHGRRRSLQSADDYFVRDRGLALREGWLTLETARALGNFHGFALPLDDLAIEEGRLLHRTQWARLGRLDGPLLLDLMHRQAALAAQLERALSTRSR